MDVPSNSSSTSRSALARAVQHRQQALLYQLSPLYLPSSLYSLAAQRSSLLSMLTASMTSQHNAACLLIGHSGSGKSLTARSALASLHAEHAPHGRHFAVVSLHGRLHGDDTAAMREIVRQLAADMEIETPPAGADFQTLLSCLLQMLASSHYARLPVFFLLDAFELFAAKGKQTLLYALCDLLQSGRHQLAIIGISTRLDCFELLEKRIRSRIFSRKILFPHLSSEDDVSAVLRDRLTLDQQRLSKARSPRSIHDIDFVPGDWEDELVEGQAEAASGSGGADVSAVLSGHDQAVTRLLSDAALKTKLQHYHRLGKDARFFLTALVSSSASRSGCGSNTVSDR